MIRTVLLATAGLVATAPLAAAQTIPSAEPSSQTPSSPAPVPGVTPVPHSGAASPDSVPARAPSTWRADWTGFYVGAHAGMSSGRSAWSATQPGVPNLSGSLSFFSPYDGFTGSGSQFGGIAAGYNDRLPSRVVIGVVADVSFAAEPAAGAAAYNDAAEAFGTARGRIGYAPHRWLYYAAGGLAWTHDLFTRNAIVPGSAGDPSSGTTETAASGRVGWTVGGGIEAPLANGWTATAEYLYSRFGHTGVPLPSGAEVISDLSTHQVRVGLNYTFGDDPKRNDAPAGPAPLEVDQWAVHGQTTLLDQYALPFHAPYSGANSLASNSQRETWDATLYLGRRLWPGAELWIDPEIDQGFGLSNTLGVAGFTSGEAYKVGFAHPYFRVQSAFIRQTFDLGNATEPVEAGLNQFGGSETANRVVVTFGKFGVPDLFDVLSNAHDPRNDMMNWALLDAGTFDYAADAWGWTYGAAVEWYQGHWTARAGLFDLSIVPNSIELDPQFDEFQIVSEFEHRHVLRGQPGKVAVAGFLSRGRMGRYDDAVALAQETGGTPNTADVRRYTGRPGVNLNVEQQVVPGVGLFGRVGWAGGQVEPYEFTDIDHTTSAGVSLGGKLWRRSNDTVGLAAVVNGISSAHIAYLAAGGLGILVGDGQLPHPGPEEILETYYRLPLRMWQVTADYQFVVNPAYNRDRGPVSVISIRLRSQF
jgi:high affinity Mn2+ porin